MHRGVEEKTPACDHGLPGTCYVRTVALLSVKAKAPAS